MYLVESVTPVNVHRIVTISSTGANLKRPMAPRLLWYGTGSRMRKTSSIGVLYVCLYGSAPFVWAQWCKCNVALNWATVIRLDGPNLTHATTWCVVEQAR